MAGYLKVIFCSDSYLTHKEVNESIHPLQLVSCLWGFQEVFACTESSNRIYHEKVLI